MNTVLSGLVGTTTLIYLDDIIIWGVSLEIHNQRLIEVFGRLRVQSLKLEPDKCEFLWKDIYFLGYKITADGVIHGRERGCVYKKITQCRLTRES